MSFYSNVTIFVVKPLYPPRPVQFTLLLVAMVVSIPCFIFVLYHFLASRALRSALNNHVIILLLISNGIQTVTDVPMRLSYYYLGVIWPSSVYYCYVWFFLDYYLFTTCFLLLTWGSVERHILVFRMQLYNTRLRRVLGHYLPLVGCWMYPLVYYVVFFFWYPCENYYDESVGNCVTPCYLWESAVMALYEQIAHGIALMCLISFFNVLLIIRVLRRRQQMGRQFTWASNRKMTLQLLSVCSLFFITNIGYFVIQIGRLLGSENFGRTVAAWVFPLSMFMPLLIPFVCLSTVQNLQGKIRRLSPFHRGVTVAPLFSRT